jgi:spore coat protein CotH
MKKMEKSMKLFISIVLVSLICLFAVNVSFATDESSLEKEIYYVVANNSKTSTKIKISKVDGENYLFLPSSADLSNLVLNCTKINTSISLKKSNGDEILIKSGEAFDFTSFYGSKPLDGIYSVKVIVKEYVGEDLPANIEDLKDIEPSSTQEMSLNIMKSSNIDSMFIQSANAETAGRDYIEASEDHSAKANGKVALVQEDGSFIYDGTLKEIKGRGNSTWRESDKKPYQIKLDKKADLINPEDGSNAGKKWVLLANSMDPSMLRNKITYDLGKELGLLNTPDCKTIDLYYDGEYRGTYLLSEKVEISKTVVNINDLESEIEDANDGVDLDTLETAKGTDKYGNEYQYVVGIKNPENITGGYLLEIDDAYYASEKSWFTTISGKHYVVKSPEYLSKEGIEYISNIINEIEICINNNGINPDTNKKLEDYIDIDSFAKYILVQELTKNSDAYISSTYMYKDKDDDKIYAGALWDFDTAYGIRTNPSYLSDAESLLLKFNFESVDSFKIKMNEIYKSEVYPLVKNILLGNTS